MNRTATPGQTRMRETPEACGLPGLASLVQGVICGKLRRLAIAMSDFFVWLAFLGLPTGADDRRQQTAEYRGSHHE